MILKLTVAAFVAAIEDDTNAHRYGLVHSLVRADGIGEWAQALDEVLSGSASQQLALSLSEARKVFTERVGRDHWQYKVVSSANTALQLLRPGSEPLGDKVALRKWFQVFPEIRNKTRGHGALTPAMCARLSPLLEESVQILCSNHPLFVLPWAYLHRNLSGKYRVAVFGGDQSAFDRLKSVDAAAGPNYPNGIYVSTGGYRRVELLHTDLDASDFYLPNGAFRNGEFELHSLITDSRLKGDGGPYMAVASQRPPSETEGTNELDIKGRVYTNMPSLGTDYVRRKELEQEVNRLLVNDRHPIVTLVGRGGIGKTSLALSVLHNISHTARFEAIIWFSARDIDLNMAGAKPVQPRSLTERDISAQYKTLVGQSESRKVDVITNMAEHLRTSPHGPTLFVFDNFETVRSPMDLFQWLDTNIRLPNKILITSRFREFKADYPVEISGMETPEAELLVQQTAANLSISHLVGSNERLTLIEEANAHPYILKIMLGEIADAGTYSKPTSLLVRRDDILDALFERTYANLTPMASRVFLTLCGWRSLVPQLAVEAILLRYSVEGGQPEVGIDQLVRMSLVERIVATDGNDFLEVPLTAALFGRRKLGVSPNRAMIEGDIRFLQEIGATTRSGLKLGLRPKVEAFFRRAARKITEGKAQLDELRPVLEFFSRSYAPAWLLLSELEQERSDSIGRQRAAECIRKFLESRPLIAEMRDAWERLLHIYRAEGDVVGGVGAFLNAADIVPPPMDDISAVANWANNASELRQKMDLTERSAILQPLAMLMERYIGHGSATDLSRLAWLHLHCGSNARALEVAKLGNQKDRYNSHCQRLVTKLEGELSP